VTPGLVVEVDEDGAPVTKAEASAPQTLPDAACSQK